MDSALYHLYKHDLIRVGQVFLHGILAAAIVQAIQLLPNLSFGPYTPLIMVAVMPVLQAIQRAFEGKPAPTVQ